MNISEILTGIKNWVVGKLSEVSIASDSGTSAITLNSGGKYKLSLANGSVIFAMPASSADNIFWATYNVTTYAEIAAAINAGKLVMMAYEPDSTHKYILTATYHEHFPIQVNTPYVQFNASIDGGMVNTRVWSSDTWDSVFFIDFEKQVVSISPVSIGGGIIALNAAEYQNLTAKYREGSSVAVSFTYNSINYTVDILGIRTQSSTIINMYCIVEGQIWSIMQD